MIITSCTSETKEASFSGAKMMKDKDGTIIVVDRYDRTENTFAGTVIHSKSWSLGTRNADWILDAFEPFYGKVTLESKP